MQKVSELLEELMRTESALLAEHEVKHGPTIGGMYEGLSAEILNKTLPLEGTELRVTRGFIRARNGKDLSSETDCMIVVGEGEQVPHTDRFIYPLDQVLVTVEIKKKLTRVLLSETLVKLNKFKELCEPMVHNGRSDESFARLLGKRPLLAGNLRILELNDELVADIVVADANMPLRVILDYSGYRTSKGLLDAYLNELVELSQSDESGTMWHPAYWPDLIVGNGIEVTKLFAAPYSCQNTKSELGLLGLSSSQFGLVFLESILWRIGAYVDEFVPVYADYSPPALKQVFSMQFDGDDATFKYLFPKNAPACALQIDWDEIPKELSANEVKVALLILHGPFVIGDETVWTNLEISEEAFHQALDRLSSSRVLSIDGSVAYGVYSQLGISLKVDGSGHCAENCRGSLTRWLGQKAAEQAKAAGQNEMPFIHLVTKEPLDMSEAVATISHISTDELLQTPGRVDINRYLSSQIAKAVLSQQRDRETDGDI